MAVGAHAVPSATRRTNDAWPSHNSIRCGLGVFGTQYAAGNCVSTPGTSAMHGGDREGQASLSVFVGNFEANSGAY